MFRALTCHSSGEQIVLSQHLVPSLSVNGCTVCWMRADTAESMMHGQKKIKSDSECCENAVSSGYVETEHVFWVRGNLDE
jgi:hypothetical protein